MGIEARVTGTLSWKYEGWNVDQAYTIFKQLAREIGYLTYESKYIKGEPRDPKGPQFHLMEFLLSKEVDYKYASQFAWFRLMIAFSNKPKPGSDPKNPVIAPYGSVTMQCYGGVKTDYVGLWGGTAVTSFLSFLKDKYFYRRKLEQYKIGVRSDLDKFIKKMNERLNALPHLS